MKPKLTTTPTTPSSPDLASQLSGYWALDNWRILDCPIDDGCSEYKGMTIHFTCQSPTIQVELKYACWQKLVRQEWKTKTLWSKAKDIKRLGEWLNAKLPKITTLLERDLIFLVTSFRSYLVNTGAWKGYTQAKLDTNQQEREYTWSAELNTLRQIYKIIQATYDNRDEYDKEVWDVRKLV